jgi:uncharacterized cupin superfamily protein
MPRKIDLATAPTRVGTAYPAPFDEPCRSRHRYRLGAAAGLTQFGVNVLRLKPGSWSSQRHWHTHEDELVYVLSGEVVLVTDSGEEVFRAGDAAGFKAGEPDGHHFQNRSDAEALLLEIGSSHPSLDAVEYPEIDLRATPAGYTHRDGTPYPSARRRT